MQAKIGDVFDKLTIISIITSSTGNNGNVAVCQCDCGSIINKRVYSLLKNKNSAMRRNHCGCIQGSSGYRVGDIPISVINKIKYNAKTRDIEYQLSHQYLADLFIRQNKKCSLTGLYLFFPNKCNLPCIASLDRIDSSVGYVPGNVQWVHKDVNLMKWDLSQDKFIELCISVAQNSI